MSKKQVSSGTEKAEKLANTSQTKQKTTQNSTMQDSTKPNNKPKTKAVKNQKAKTEQKNTTAKTQTERAKNRSAKQQARAERKLRMAELRAEKKQRRIEKRAEIKERRAERKAAAKERVAERKEARRERRAALKSETREQRAERKMEERQQKRNLRLAKKQARAEALKAKREHRLALKAERRARKAERSHTAGFGGWLAAVISLGVITLALGAMVTYSWMGYNDIQANLAKTETESLYELNSLIDNLDANLAKARVANATEDSANVFADIAVESQMVETVLERMPLNYQATQNIASFYNKMSDSARGILSDIAQKKALSESQQASIAYMYQTNAALKQSLNGLTSSATAADMLQAVAGKGGALGTTFDDIQNNVIETPKEIYDGPFAESVEKVNAKALQALKEITAPEAEKLAKEYFKAYKVTEATCTGEAVAKELVCYNIALKTEDGEMFAQLSKKGGKVVLFDSYKTCTDKKFSTERCEEITQDFLTTLGYQNMKAVWTSESGTTCNLNFAYNEDGVICYPDLIKVKVCEERGIVTGIEAFSYVLNHTERDLAQATVTKSEAQKAISKNIQVKGSRLCLIPYNNSEVLAYEFYGSSEGNDYYVYVNADSGKEVKLFTVIGTAQGRALL